MDIFFAISRDKLRLREQLESYLNGQDQSHPNFCWEDGEFCFFYFNENRLVFGRDVFGRKSLCWRKGPANSESRLLDNYCCTFELSLLPGHGNDDQQEGEWHEVPPGTLFSIPIPDGTKSITQLNPKIGGKFPNLPILDFVAEIVCAKEGFIGQDVVVETLYPFQHFCEDPIFRIFFPSFAVKEFNSGILLEPHHAQLKICPSEAEISTLTDEFIQRFNAVVENILKTVPLIGGSGKDGFADLDVPVLFSGGVDSLMVALSMGDVLFRRGMVAEGTMTSKIRLFTVAFGEKEEDYSDAPDRSHSVAAFEQLRQRSLQKYGLNPYSLVLVNVPKSELIECRKKFIAEAIAPSKTLLDDSIGCVLWFATRMAGIECANLSGKIESKSPFAFVGSGSDEQLGGYARHRTCFEGRGLEGLEEELSMEMHRIGQRNFGRDDRVGMSNGRAILAPFLEEPLVHWLNTVPTPIKTGFGLPAANSANKFLLRNALRSLGMPEAIVQRPKKAMQFGTRIAKLDRIPGQKGSDICHRLLEMGREGGGDSNNGQERAMNNSTPP